MKHSIVLKFLALTLAAVSLVLAVGCAAGIVAIESAGLYVGGLEILQDQEYASTARVLANSFAERYAAETLGQLPYSLKESLYSDPAERSDADHWYITLSQDSKILVDEGRSGGEFAYSKDFFIAPLYIVASLFSPEEMAASSPTNSTDPADDPISSAGSVYEEITVPPGYLYYTQETSFQNGRFLTYYLYYYQAPEYSVTVYLREAVLESSSIHLLTVIYPHRYTCVSMLVICLLTAAICIVYLLCAAGHCADGSICPGALNRLPLDLYAVIAGGGIAALTFLFFSLCEWVEAEGPHLGNLSLLGVNLLGIALLVLAFLFAFAAQVKAKNAFWWRHSIIGWCCSKLAQFFRFAAKCAGSLRRLLPVIWQWTITAAVMAISLIVSLLLAVDPISNGFFLPVLLFVILACIVIVLYGGYCFGTLMKGARRMSEGDLGCKINTKYLRGSFLDFANQLNSLSQAALVSAQKQMQSERMKSELITNVSHDIKTPLTSIINFVDLLQKPHTDEQQQEYLEVLSRQSAQMKKLIEDLMELSKASSGNIAVNPETMDAAETVNQALGEFSDKLEAAGLVPVFRQPQQRILLTADGRLVWRVLSNVLTNVVKYALPGTRVYVDLVQLDGQVLLSVKNISRAELNIPAEELLERFVRGDSSRKSEGSGLGLNIAKNLMEVQGGQLQLLLDGDLFKVTLIFPAAQ